MSDQLQFKVSAELKNILGKDLITSPSVAILELVKNSFDAHAHKVEVTFNDDLLIIADDGKGMSLNDLKNKWLFVAYSAKRDGTEDSSYRDNIKRHYAGAKGIGRLSCDSLAQYLKLETRSEKGETETLAINWESFENDQAKEFDRVSVEHNTTKAIPVFPNNSKTGTILTFSALRSKWGRKDILSLKRSLEKMINPFSGIDDFKIELIAPKEAVLDRDAPKYGVVNGIITNTISEVLSIKTTKIETWLTKDAIRTIVSDRGVIMYEIEEPNKYQCLSDATISIFYLNKAAKYSFTKRMGVQPVGYGNIFLFRNGFRILPYGEPNDDSWGLNRRNQQGYKRFLSTRDLFGRVDVETAKIDDFREVSSRDGGLIDTPAAKELRLFFDTVFKRLERYVVGVLWGEGFIKRAYFKDQEAANLIRKQLQNEERDSETPDHIYNNIGSRVDFLQLIKNLVNEDSVTVKYYNTSLASIVEDVSATDLLQDQLFEDMRRLAEKTNNSELKNQISSFESHVEKLRTEKEKAERQAEEARKIAEEEQQRRYEEEQKRKEVEAALETKKKQNLFLQSIGVLDKEKIIEFHHDIRQHALTIQNSISNIYQSISEGRGIDCIREDMEALSMANDRIIAISQYATKANFNSKTETIKEDIVKYIYGYIYEVLSSFYGGDVELKCLMNDCSLIRSFKPLEISSLFDNLVTNSIKAGARTFVVSFSMEKGKLIIDIYDDGQGLSPKIGNPSDIFEIGVTTTYGSGIGLYNVSNVVKNELNGSISVISNFRFSSSKKGFNIRIIL